MKKGNNIMKKIKQSNQIEMDTLPVSLQPSIIHGEGLLALCDFVPGEIICISKGYIVKTRNRYSIQLDSNYHFIPTYLVGTTINGLSKVNHACDPNSYVQFNQKYSFLVLKTLRNISKEEEITFDYCSTEIELSQPFFCRCNKNNCRRFIYGSRFET